jgi:uncharacterized protein
LQRLIEICLEQPLRTIAVATLLTLVAGSGVFRLGIAADYRVYFGADNPQLIDFEQQEALFYQSDSLVFGVAGDIFTPAALAAVEWLTQHARTLPHVSRVISVTNYPHPTTRDDVLTVGPLVRDAANLSPDAARAVAVTARDAEDIRGRLVSRDGYTAFVVASVQLPGIDEREETSAVMFPARQLTAEFRRRWPDLEAHLFGVVPFNQTLSETILRDLRLLFPLSIALMGVALWWFLGAVPTLITACAVAMSTATAMGLAGWSGVALTTATAVAPVIVLTLAISNSVHLVAAFQRAVELGQARAQAVRHSLRLNLAPVALTSGTTVVGFLSLNYSDAPPFRELGNIVAVGVIVSWATALLVVPALLLLLGGGELRRANTAYWAAFGRGVIRHHRRIIAGTLVLTLPVVAALPLNSINDVFREWVSLRDPVRAGIEFGIDRMGGAEEIHYTLDSGQSDGVVELAFAAQAQAFGDWMRSQPEVAHVSDYLPVLKRMNRVLREDLPGQYQLPESADLAGQFLSVYELAQPAEHSLNTVLDLDKRRARVSVTMRPGTSSELVAFDRRARGWLALHAPQIQARQASGALMMFAELGQRNSRSLLWGSTVALTLISASLMVAMRSVLIGAVSLIPNLIPAAAGFGLWGIFSGEINIAISIVLGMTLGIVVDDTIHFLSKYQRARLQLGLSPPEAVEHAFTDVGRAMWVTTAVLVGGFLVLMLSDFRPTNDMGLLTAVVLVLALALDLLLLPSLLLWTDRPAASTTRSEP